jgi:hypothetical protein
MGFRVRDKESMQRSIMEVSGSDSGWKNGGRTQAEDGRMTREPPTQLTLQLLTACAQVDTCLPGAACVPFCTRSFSKNLGQHLVNCPP